MARAGWALCSVALTSLVAWMPADSPDRATHAKPRVAVAPRDDRKTLIARAGVWESTDIASKDLLAGPTDKKPFRFDETVNCTWVDKPMQGKTPKFSCRIDPDDEVKVKIGGDNGEVYAEVAATRLLWALGFGADRMYSVRVICRGCPVNVSGVVERGSKQTIFDPAAIERKMPGVEMNPSSWAWPELEIVDAPADTPVRAERDALKLLAVFMQHSDSKPEQQRLICLDTTKHEAQKNAPATCQRPFMYINDLGVTFGRANPWNNGAIGSMNLVEWSRTPVWKDPDQCIGNLPRSVTGTLDDPKISEAGRQFLADLLERLSDDQLRQLFTAARVQLRLRNPEDLSSGFPAIDEWVAAFRAKREQIVNRRCSAS